MTRVLIMAGGRGLRLHPLTERCPKPMLRVGTKPLLEIIVDRLVSHGFRDITLAVNYRADIIEDYFGDGEAFGARISYIRESREMGTAGAVAFMESDAPFIVHNADIISDIDYNDLMRRHDEATVCLALHQYQVPFGVADVLGDGTVRLREKPIENFSVSAGIYVLPQRAIGMVKGKMDMPDLLNKFRVKAYQIEGYWQDVGHFQDLAAAHINWQLKVQ